MNMHIHGLSSRVAIFVLFVTCAVHSPAADPAKDNGSIPAPPMQGKPWTPPATKLPPVVVDAVKELFDQGMADPRGCEYREVEISAGRPYEPNQKIHAWVLPGDGATRYAVSWNGRVIPVVSVGGAADLRKDIPVTGLGEFRTQWGLYDWTSISEKSALPIKAALLLRLDEADRAEGMMNGGKWSAGDDPYEEISREWLISWFNRGKFAFFFGDDALALRIFKAVGPLEKTLETAAAHHNSPKPAKAGPYLDELSDLPMLLADEERRLQEPPHLPALNSGIIDQHERIAALIRDLELIHTEPMSNKSQTDVSWDATVQALIHEGDAAVEPLIDCLEHDERLTRTQFDPGGWGSREHEPWIRVYEPAYVALAAILRYTPGIPLPQGKKHDLSPEDRKAIAAKFREYWAAHKALTPQERWFAKLQDDNASPKEWFQAAADITQRTNQSTVPSGMFGGGGGSSYSTDKPLPMRGEPLRAKSNPSVSDLLIKRLSQLLPLAGKDPAVTLGPMGNLLFALADWDGKERVSDIQKLVRQFNGTFGYSQGDFTSTAKINAAIYQKRFAAGDPAALADYARWLLTLQPDVTPGEAYMASGDHDPAHRPVYVPGDSLGDTFRLMWEHPDDQAINQAAVKMFSGKDAPWHPGGQNSISLLLNTPMLGIAPFREQVFAALDNTTAIGFARRWPNGNVQIRMNSEGPDPDPPKNPPPGTDVRVCDFYANKLAGAEIFPVCELDWPREKRDTAIARSKALLTQYGDAFRNPPADPQFESIRAPSHPAQPVFPRLGHPATAQDVAQGRAIFSLEGEVRTVPLPPFPVHADRPASKQDPQRGMESDGNGNSKDVTTYTTDGHVWQAEEVKVNGQWERYYGFTGRHQLEKVPASEINFPGGAPWTWAPVTPFFDGALDMPESKQLRNVGYNSYAASGTEVPLLVMFKAHNRSGLDRKVPAELMIAQGAAKTLPAAIILHLSYSEKIAPKIANAPAGSSEPDIFLMSGPPPFDYGAWNEIPLRKEITVADNKIPGPELGAAGEITLLQLDLRDYFDMAKPGTYRLQVAFKTYDQPPAPTEYRPPNLVTFTVLEKTSPAPAR